MKISILIPVYGVEKYIERCARSVLQQDGGGAKFDVEYVFVDDASPDHSIEILHRVLKDYPECDVRILAHDVNIGLAAARNTAVDAATGDYILHVDSDDWVAPQTIEKLTQCAVETDADIVVGGSVDVYSSFAHRHRENISGDYLRDVLWRRTRGSIWGKLLRRELYEGIRAIPGLDYGEDFLVYPQLVARARKIVELDEPLYFYNLANAGAISTRLTVAKARQMTDVVDRLSEIFSADAALVEGMKLHTKIALLQTGDRNTWRYVRSFYRDTPIKKGARLNFGERLVLFLSRLHLHFLMPLYRRWAVLKRQFI